MFDLTVVELISQAASNSLFAFCFCNLIIVIILMRSKLSSGFHESQVLISMPACKIDLDENPPLTAEIPCDHGEERPVEDPKGADAHCNIQIEDEGCDREEDEDHDDGGNDDEDDDGLRTRIEDFIAKVNREWQAEKLRANAASREEDKSSMY